jgi:hypothetical protein
LKIYHLATLVDTAFFYQCRKATSGKTNLNMFRPGQVGNVQNVGEGRQHLHLLQNLLSAGRADDQQPSTPWRVLLQQHQ